MKHFLILGTFIEPCPLEKAALLQAIDEHLTYLDQGFASGMVLLSGPYAQGAGGIILVKAESADEVQAFIAQDPLYLAKAQAYEVIEYHMHKCQPLLSEWF